MPDTVTIIDNRTGKQYEVPIEDGTIRALALRQIKVDENDFGLMTFDPAYQNTAHCRSSITYIDGDKGILRHRGYAIEDLAVKCKFLEVAYLLVNGKLPNHNELENWRGDIKHRTLVHQSLTKFIDGFRSDSHPMNMLISAVAALSAFYPDAKDVGNPQSRNLQVIRIIGKVPTLAAFIFRHCQGLPLSYPDNEFSYSGNFLNMMFKMGEPRYKVHPTLEHAMDILFMLHADHEQNCSTASCRSVGSSLVDPYCAVAASAAALYGPLHGGANEAVIRMLMEIGDKKNIPSVLDDVKAGKRRLMGFGHRIYKNYDPRAKIIKKLADEVFEVTGTNPLLDIALELERIALEDEYFIQRKLYPNVDFYSGLMYQSMGFPMEMFPVLFAIGRTAGWLAHWLEMFKDPEFKIARPRQIYTGEDLREVPTIDERS